ncbi:MAG: hypothetical protein JWL82_550 [Parcubacteria group bacterium]|nr:hypothetical protein [Parcubacteria group bacterium]
MKRKKTLGTAWLRIPALGRIGISMLGGAVASALAGEYLSWSFAPLVFWDVTAAIAVTALWLSLLPMDAEDTKKHATTEDPGRGSADIVMIVAGIASLAAVTVLLFDASKVSGVTQMLDIGLGIISVVVSWTVLHVMFMLRYADLYFEEKGSIDFNTKKDPTYQDFAYVAFTIGMTYQVSDTSLKTSALRKVARRHALLSYVFGTAIIATTINALAGITK